jgi:transposase
VNALSEENKQQVLALGRLGWSLRRIERAVHIRCETVSTYLKAAGIPVRPPGGWGRGHPKPAIQVSTDPGQENGPADETPTPASTPSASACEPFREFIETELAKSRNAMAIWQDLVDGHGFTEKYASVKRFVRKLRGSSTPEARVVIETAVGEEAQVDYGTGPMVRDTQTGKYRRTRLFVLTLGYSRKAVRLLVFRSSARVWAELHEKAFRRLGGVTRVVVLDNLREGVLTPDIYEPTLNPLYRHVLQHYGATALPCRVQDPDRKAYVSYCTLSGPCNVESWLLGTPTSLAFENGILVDRFV